MFFDLFPSPINTGAKQSRVSVNLSSNSQDQNDLIVNELYDEIIKPINSAEIDREVNIRSPKIISEVEGLDIGDKRKILEKLWIKLNEYFNQKIGEINRTQDESTRELLRAGFQARIDIFKNFKENINQTSNSSILSVDPEVNGGGPASREVNGGNESQDPSILPKVKQVAVVDKRSESRNSYFEDFKNAIQYYTNSKPRTKDNLPKNEFKDYEIKEIKIKDELLEMKTSQDPKDNIFFKNYLLKHSELIKLYEDGKEVMIKKFQERGADKNLVNQKIDPLIREAHQDCLNFLLANSQARLKNPVGENLENDLDEEQQPIRPSDPVAKILESESHRGDGVRIHSCRPTPKSKAR